MKKIYFLIVVVMVVLAACGAPATEVPATEVTVTEMPVTELPVTEVPATEMPVTEAPVSSTDTLASVVFGDDANIRGAYVQTGQDTWEEQGLDGAIFNFVETARDENFITLFDESRTTTIQLDLKNKVVNYEDPTQKIAPLYFIADATVISVVFGDGTNIRGAYVQTGQDTWEEQGLDGAIFNFVETARDENFITLFDESRTATIQLDLKNKVVNYEDPTQKIAPLYFITDVAGISVVFGDGTNIRGAYVQTGQDTWEEQGLDGAIFNFVETARDENFITLFDESRTATIQLDLKNKVVNYEDPTQKIAPLYFITEIK